jgi:glycosyltransferase involved in cell wall biosynthesis
MSLSPARPVRVMYLTHTAKLSGAELGLARLLAALDRTRVEPIVALAEDGPLRGLLTSNSVETIVLPLNRKVLDVRRKSLGVTGVLRQVTAVGELWRYARRIGRLAQERGIDLIHANSLKAGFYGSLAGRFARVPVIWHVHDRIEEDYLPRAMVWLIRGFARYVPACIVANSRSTLGTLRLKATQHSAVIAPGVSREHLDCGRVERPPNPLPRVGIIGRIAPWKGQDIFLRAAAQLLHAGTRLHFCVAGAPLFGEEDFERELRQLTDTLGIRNDVEFLGFIHVPKFLPSLDILVHASKIPEPFGQVIAEGLAARVPVIATDAGGVREIIENGRTGILVPMNDPAALANAIARLLDDPETGRRLAAAGRNHVLEHLTVERSARASETLYERLMEYPVARLPSKAAG